MTPSPTPRKRAERAWDRLGCGIGLGLVLMLIARAVGAEEAEASVPLYVEYRTGFEFTRGDYGFARDSSLYYVPLSTSIYYGRLHLNVFVPLLYTDGVVASRLGGPGLPPREESDRIAGLGQIATGASLTLDPFFEGAPWIDVGGEVLWPTRTAEALGTGGFGFTLRTDLYDQFHFGSPSEGGEAFVPSITPLVSVGRNFYVVDSLRDRFFTTVGFATEVADGVSVGGVWDWLQATSRDLEDTHQLVPFARVEVAERWSIGPYGVIGLSEGAPDYGVGLSVSFGH